MKRKTIFFVLKLAFGLGLLLYLVLVIARPREIIAVLGSVSWPLLLLAFSPACLRLPVLGQALEADPGRTRGRRSRSRS